MLPGDLGEGWNRLGSVRVRNEYQVEARDEQFAVSFTGAGKRIRAMVDKATVEAIDAALPARISPSKVGPHVEAWAVGEGRELAPVEGRPKYLGTLYGTAALVVLALTGRRRIVRDPPTHWFVREA